MTWHELELLARGGTLALLALWSWILVRDHWQQLPARVAVAMNIAIGCYVVLTSGWAERPSPAGLVLAVGAASTPGLFWLFAKSWFGDETKLDWRGVALVVLFAANALLMQLTFSSKPPVFYVAGAVFRIGMLAFAIGGLWAAWRGREEDLVEGRRRLRLGLIGVVGAYVVLIAIAEVAVFQGGVSRSLLAAIGGSTVLFTLAFCAAMFGARQPELFGAKPVQDRVSTPGAAEQDGPLVQRILAHMDREMPHRDETMTITKLAAQLSEPEYRLRRVINGTLGHRNFAQFLNSYRLAEVKAALADPSQKDVPILTIALDAGFGSLGPFNRAFRDAEGMTPTAYRAQHQ